jgi:hypothetical protein
VITAPTPHTAANAKKIRTWAKGRSALKHFRNNLDKLDLVPSQRKWREPAGWRKSRGASCLPAEEAAPALGVYRGRCQAGSNLGWV